MTALVVPDGLLYPGNPTRVSLRSALEIIKREADAAVAGGTTVYSPPPNLTRFRGRRSHAFSRRGESLDAALITHAAGKVALHVRLEAGSGDYELARASFPLTSPEPVRTAVEDLRSELSFLIGTVRVATSEGHAVAPHIDEDEVIALLAPILLDDYVAAYAKVGPAPLPSS